MTEPTPQLNTEFNRLSPKSAGNGPVLATAAQAFIPPAMQGQDDETAKYFPDAMVGAALAVAQQVLPQAFAVHTQQEDEFALASRTPPPPITERRFTLAESQQLIVAAFTEFDPELGQRALDIINDENRWYLLEEVEPGQCRRQQCRPAGSENDYNFNPKPHAVIEYQFDGTIDGVVYMAHEIGHAIADDIQRENGHSYKTNPEHLQETQAYFTQHILYNHLKQSDDPSIRDAAEKHYTATMTRNLYRLPVAENALAAENAHAQGRPIDASKPITQWFGTNWDKHELADEIFETVQGVNHLNPEAEMPESLRKKLDSHIDLIHCRPMSLIAAQGIVEKLQNADPATRRDMRNQLYGANGPQHITGILAGIGVKDADGLKEMTQDVFRNATQRIGINSPSYSPQTPHSRPARPG